MSIRRPIPRDRTRLDVLGDVAAGRGIDGETAQGWLKALVNGKAVDRLSDSGRPVIRVAATEGEGE